MKYRRNAPLTDSQAAALRGILASHAGGSATNPRRRFGRKRRISASLRRVLLKNLRKARRVRMAKLRRRSRR